MNVTSGMHVWPNVVASHVRAELPFMATEPILMACVAAGGDRQLLHEAIREHSMEAGRRVKEEGATNDLLERIAADDIRRRAIGRRALKRRALRGPLPGAVDELPRSRRRRCSRSTLPSSTRRTWTR